jgi:hypothetical protein
MSHLRKQYSALDIVVVDQRRWELAGRLKCPAFHGTRRGFATFSSWGIVPPGTAEQQATCWAVSCTCTVLQSISHTHLRPSVHTQLLFQRQ